MGHILIRICVVVLGPIIWLCACERATIAVPVEQHRESLWAWNAGGVFSNVGAKNVFERLYAGDVLRYAFIATSSMKIGFISQTPYGDVLRVSGASGEVLLLQRFGTIYGASFRGDGRRIIALIRAGTDESPQSLVEIDLANPQEMIQYPLADRVIVEYPSIPVYLGSDHVLFGTLDEKIVSVQLTTGESTVVASGRAPSPIDDHRYVAFRRETGVGIWCLFEGSILSDEERVLLARSRICYIDFPPVFSRTSGRVYLFCERVRDLPNAWGAVLKPSLISVNVVDSDVRVYALELPGPLALTVSDW